MEPVDVISIERPEEADPWPRILRLIALLALLFAAGQILLDSQTIQANFVWTTYKGSSPQRWRTFNHLQSALAVADALDCGLMFVGALAVLKYREFQLPIVLAAKIWLVIWVLWMAVTLWAQGWRGVEDLGRGALWTAFPLAII